MPRILQLLVTKKINWGELSRSEREATFLKLPFKQAWKTKLHWGTISQAILLLLYYII